MRCPACEAQNPNDATQCSACGKALTRRPRRRGSGDDADAPVSPEAERRNSAAAHAYRLCLWGLVPGLGLVLGPVATVLGAMARIRGDRVPGFSGKGPATVAILLGILIAASQWAGVALMVIGWSERP
jgi:hypothetical protein